VILLAVFVLTILFLWWATGEAVMLASRWLDIKEKHLAVAREQRRADRIQRQATAARADKLERDKLAVQREALVRPAITDRDPMPKDLLQWALSENAIWAQEDFKKRARELYADLGDWDKVRTVLGSERQIGEEATTSTFDGMGV
jgi:hypothetical protein